MLHFTFYIRIIRMKQAMIYGVPMFLAVLSSLISALYIPSRINLPVTTLLLARRHIIYFYIDHCCNQLAFSRVWASHPSSGFLLSIECLLLPFLPAHVLV